MSPVLDASGKPYEGDEGIQLPQKKTSKKTHFENLIGDRRGFLLGSGALAVIFGLSGIAEGKGKKDEILEGLTEEELDKCLEQLRAVENPSTWEEKMGAKSPNITSYKALRYFLEHLKNNCRIKRPSKGGWEDKNGKKSNLGSDYHLFQVVSDAEGNQLDEESYFGIGRNKIYRNDTNKPASIHVAIELYKEEDRSITALDKIRTSNMMK